MRINRTLGTHALAWTVFVVALGSGVASPVVAQTDDAAIQDIRAYLDRLESEGFAGSVVISRAGDALLAEGYGLADRERGIRWSPETVSTIGSITKQFTGAAILALVEAGAVDVNDSIGVYFDDVPEEKRGITLHHLLTHSSGIVDLHGFGDWDAIGRQEFVRRVLDQDLVFEPGSGHQYSNANYSLLGAIIEQETGRSWEEYLRERLWLPSEMSRTGYILPEWEEGRFAQGYRGDTRWGTVLERPLADDGPYWVLRANGGVHASAWDMVRWGEALLAGEPLSAESMDAFWAPHVDEGGGDSHYGYGWVVTDLAGRKVITHNGGNRIFFADMAIVPDEELVIVLLCNVSADFRRVGRLLGEIGGRLLAGFELPG